MNNSTETITNSKEQAPEKETEGEAIKSPMVGTLYHSSKPGDPPLVKVGQSIRKGDIICIIEAMKSFNQIKAERDGTISKIMADNGEAVEYGQVLFLVK